MLHVFLPFRLATLFPVPAMLHAHAKKTGTSLLKIPANAFFHYALYSTPFLKLWLLLKRKNPIQ